MLLFRTSFSSAAFSRSIGFLGFVAITWMTWNIPDKVAEPRNRAKQGPLFLANP
jgi:hypothetical protein